jgi:cobaltochelatase CobN
MKPNAIDKEIWEGIESVYIQDKYKLGMEKYFRDKNPYALQEITAVMLETIRKGYWQPDAAVIKRIAELHARLVIDHKAGCSGFVCDNAKLQAMIQNALKPEMKADYKRQIDSARVGETGEKKKGMELKKEKMSLEKVKELVKENITTVVAVFIILLLFSAAVIVGMARHRK